MHQPRPSILVLDLEATCSNDGSFPPEAMEIIEIGAVWATYEGTVLDQFQTFVRPLQRPILTPFCTRLTNIRQIDIDTAQLLPLAARKLRQFVERHRDPGAIWTSWGAYDCKQLERDCTRHAIENPVQLPHENLKRLFAREQRLGKEVTLATACGLANLKLEGAYHRALDDAINTARLLPWAWGNQSLGAIAAQPTSRGR